MEVTSLPTQVDERCWEMVHVRRLTQISAAPARPLHNEIRSHRKICVRRPEQTAKGKHKLKTTTKSLESGLDFGCWYSFHVKTPAAVPRL